METSLDRLRPGQAGVVGEMDVVPLLVSRLRDLGLVPGTVVCCRCRTPDGSVTALDFRSTTVALRTKDIRRVRVWC